MGNLLVCFKSAKETSTEDDYEAFQRDVYRSGRSSAVGNDEDTGSEERIERRGSVFPPSPSTYRSSLGPSSIIPPYIEGSSQSLRRAAKSPSSGSTDTAPVKKAKEVRILLLGSGESGKSTITKQMKVIHQNGYSRDEMIAFRPAVFRNIRQGIEQVIQAAQKLNLTTILSQAVSAIKTTRECSFDPETATTIPKQFVDAVNYIWLESGVKTIFDQLAHASYVFDSASYFFDNINRIGKPDYIPSTEDILRARIKTVGISETLFRSGLLTVRMIDIGGQRPERKNWIRTFEGVTTIIFCVSLSEYDQCLLEEPTQNRLLESFQLFQSIVTSRWFVNTSIVLFLNKKDIFQRKITKIPLSDYFPDYTGSHDYGRATDFIKQKFLGLNVNKLQIYPYLTEATDTNNINLVFAAVKETVLANSLKQSDKKVKVGLAQFATVENKAVNIARALEQISNAAQLGADIIVLPECFNTPYGGKYYSNPSLPESIPDGPTSVALSKAAHRFGVWIFGGSIPEFDETTGKIYNTCSVFDRRGSLAGRFRKMHLFDVDIPERITFRESDSFTAGTEPLIVETEYGKIGVGICYDLRFPELSLYYSEQGCFMLVFPSAFSETTGSLHWDILTRTRALDNQVFVLGCQGVPTPQYNSWGHSVVCGPLGNVLARAGREETLILVDLDIGSIQEVRQSIPVLNQKRFDLYNKINFRDPR